MNGPVGMRVMLAHPERVRGIPKAEISTS